ncbi:glycosyltransferase family 2 protein [Neosynechococcus sphagnicola]|uniref:glycosyltransferase family 2 protein n=1 Tax=Neosynechococcus sphagnicola TaxID=1501145 RepID=UPI00068EB317|nr:glycosyltransferase family 2 protein [Neosynechococcus sphagnicola]
MRCPSCYELPLPPADQTGWPWTHESLSHPLGLAATQDWPRISIVIPSYNQGEFIEATIRSVLLQGYPDLECLIMDGGSSDQTLGIIRQYEPWLTAWVSEPDRGQTHAINKGWQRATGELVAYLNSDDLLYPNGIWAIACAYQNHPTADLIYGAGAKINTQNQVLQKIPYRPYNPKLLRTRCYILSQSLFIRRQAVAAVGWLDESLYYTMDWELTLRMTPRFPMVAIPDDVGMWRRHPATKTWAGGWDFKREIAAVGRRHNGMLDRNFLVFWPLFWCDQLATRTQWGLFKTLGQLLRWLFDRIYGADTYMMR